MNERQLRFIEHYIQTGNASAAARLAGYSIKSAYSIGERLLRNVEVREAIDARLRDLASKKVATTQEVLEHLTLALRGEIKEEVVTPSGKKFTVSVRECDRLRAAEMLLKVSGAFKDKVDVKLDATAQFLAAIEKVWAEDGAGVTSVSE